MSVGPPLSGSAFAFALTVIKDVFIYIKHKRRRVIDLLEDFENLKDEVDDLLVCWEVINDIIDRQSASREKNRKYTIMGKKVRRKVEEFKKIDKLYRKHFTDIESRVGAASGSNAGTDGHRSQNAVDENQTPRNVAANKNRYQRSQEAENGSQKNTSRAANENQAGIEKQKIWTRNFFKLARLDKYVVKLKDEITELKKELERGGFTRPANPKIVEIMDAEELGDIVPSHQKHLDDLLKYVKQETCKRIGIYGPPGVGKTNILKKLNNNGNLNVEYVIWVTVSEENNQERVIQTIQEEIINRLKLTVGNTIRGNRDIISSFISSKKYLLILDDFSPLVKLEDVGIQKEHGHGKVVMAAKNSYKLRNVELDENIEIKPLEDPDALKLLEHFIEDYNGLQEKQKDLVYPIVKQLGGLPVFIKLTARLLNKFRQFEDWNSIKKESQSDVKFSHLVGMAPVIASYKKVYEDLEQNYMQKCLLYAALFPSGYKICRNTLVECWKAENFLDCHLPTLDAARAAGTLVFIQLTSSCLLESCCERYVKMPVFFRKVAFVISFPGEGHGTLCVRAVADQDGNLEEREWKNSRRVSLIGNSLEPKALPISPQCESLSTLLLQDNRDLKFIKYGFFINMKVLRVLSLHGTGITSLPSSISHLIALRSLYLNDCYDLKKLPTTIKLLRELEVLDIRGTSIPCLQVELILNLVSLRCLRISFAAEKSNLPTGLKGWIPFKWILPNQSWIIFPPDAHTKLSNLEEMTIDFKGEVSEQVLNKIRKEADLFKIKYEELGTHPGQSFGPYSQESKDETGQPSNVVEEPARSPSNVDERPAGIATSSAIVLQSKNSQISDGQNTAFQSHSHVQKASPREDKGKRVAKPPFDSTDDETHGSVADQLRKASRNADRRRDTSAGEGTSAAH